MSQKTAPIKTIVKEPNLILRGQAGEVRPEEISSSKIQSLISAMKVTLKVTPDGVGLAAPQVGEPLRIFLVSEEAEEIDKLEKDSRKRNLVPRERQEGELEGKPYEIRDWRYYVFINPKVKNHSRKTQDGVEGCLSVPGKFGVVRRYEKITVEARDEHGRKFVRGASNFFARVVQHELDHLEGLLFIDKAEKFLE